MMGFPVELAPRRPWVTAGALSLPSDWSRPLWGHRRAIDILGPALAQFSAACRPLVFPLLWMFIGAVSSYDAYLTLKFEDSIVAMELNPLGQFLLHLDEGDPSLFMGIKFAGTLIVLGVLNQIHRLAPSFGLKMTTAVASFQACLLGFLTL